MNRGSPSRRPRGCGSSLAGFNEAPIHESGKCAILIRTNETKGSFNEAPIHESGKYQAQYTTQAAFHASMRPRFMNRGS